MQNSNIEEYKLIRIEMNNLKDCITKYIGYALAGSGAMIYGLARIDRTSSGGIAPEIAIIAAAFSILLSLILLVIFYKFNSHNRFAGFCKMLNHERYKLIDDQNKTKNMSSLFSWEVTVGDLRWFERSELDKKIIEKLKIDETDQKKLIYEITQCLGPNPSIDKGKRIKGFCILLKTLFLQNIKTNSWSFPPLVVIIFLFLSSGFMLASYFVTCKIGFFNNLGLVSFEAVITIFQLFLWIHFSGKLFSLMNGSTTVYSFFWKFIPLRTLFLNKFNVTPSYISIEG